MRIEPREDEVFVALQGAGGWASQALPVGSPHGECRVAASSGGLLARTDHAMLSVANPNAHAYYHSDANGNVTCMVNTNGAVVARYRYDPYGNLIGKSRPLADANRYRFSSKEWHANAGLYYYGFRFYEPNLQRWPYRDPIGEYGGLNLYAFVENNSVGRVDPLGLHDCPFWAEYMSTHPDGVEDLGALAGAVGEAIKPWVPSSAGPGADSTVTVGPMGVGAHGEGAFGGGFFFDDIVPYPGIWASHGEAAGPGGIASFQNPDDEEFHFNPFFGAYAGAQAK